MKLRIAFLILLLLQTEKSLAQEKQGDRKAPDSTGVVADRLMPTTLPLLLFDEPERKAKKKSAKKKIKKNIFYGEQTKKAYIKQTVRDQSLYQFFHYTSSNRKIDPYIRDIHWYDYRDKIIRVKDYDSSRGYLLHGPYEKRAGETIIEKGNFFFGTKHGTWMNFDSKSILLNKLHFYEGWPKDSKVTYYNRSEQQIEKLTPIEYELMEGNFFHFYENGQIAVTGEYQYGERVGLWTEFWDNKNKVIRKREIQYQETPFTKYFKPFIRAEWDKEGNLVYRKN
jgi:antitoxin component YwqK of YwqJK toxin-antitoxin module